MLGSSIRVGRLAGIPIGVQPLWLLIVALITWSLGQAYYPEEVPGIAQGTAYALGLGSAVLLFASILLHELGHALVARRYGVEVEEIDLWLLGGVAKLKGTPQDPRGELRWALAGPAVTVVIAGVFAGIAAILPASTPDAVDALVRYQALVNVLILGFNLLPAFPLDGGRALRALLWSRMGDAVRATAVAATVGRGFAYALIGLGVLSTFAGAPGGLWLALIGIFLVMAAGSEERALRIRRTFAGGGLHRVMAIPAVTVASELSAERALRDYFLPYGYHAFPVLEDGRPLGLITLDPIQALPAAERAARSVGELANRDPELVVAEDVSVDSLLESDAFRRVGRAVVVCDDGEIGILSSTAMERALRARELLAPPTSPAGGGADPRSGARLG